MKKIIAVVVPLAIAVALLGAPALPVARAEESNNSAAKTARTTIEKKRQAIQQEYKGERADNREQRQGQERALRGEVQQARQRKEAAVDALRDLNKSEVKKLQEELKAATTDAEREALRQAITVKKDQFREKVKAAESEFKEQRDQLRKNMNEKSVAGRKQGLHSFIKERLRLLSLIKERIVLEDIGDVYRTRLTAEVDKLIGQLNAFDAEVDSKTTMPELKVLARKIREAITASKQVRKAIRAEIRAARQTSPTTVAPAVTPPATTPTTPPVTSPVTTPTPPATTPAVTPAP